MNVILPADYRAEIQKIAQLVGSTLGPYGNNVHFYAGNGPGGGPIALRDGALVLQNFSPQDDKTANVAARVRERSMRTARETGDSSTTTVLLLNKLYSEMMDRGLTGRANAMRLRQIATEVLAALDFMKIDVDTLELLTKVTTLAAGNNKEIGEKVAGLIYQIGKSGVVTMEADDSISELQVERIEGVQLEGGAYHESMVAQKGKKVEVVNPYIFMIDSAQDFAAIKPIMDAWIGEYRKTGRPMVVVSRDLQGSALTTLVRRTDAATRTLFPIYSVKVDIAAGSNVDDIAAIVGGVHFSEHNGSSVKHFRADQIDKFLGSADKVVIDMRRAVFFGAKDDDRVKVRENQILALKEAKEMSPDQVKLIDARLANLRSNVGKIRLPVVTQSELAYESAIVEDAYMAAQTALREGALPGCGVALILAAGHAYDSNDSVSEVVLVAAKNVIETLLCNGGVSEPIIQGAFIGSTIHTVLDLNAETLEKLNRGELEFVNPVEAGILDAYGSVASAFRNAVDEAASWLETQFVVLPQH